MEDRFASSVWNFWQWIADALLVGCHLGSSEGWLFLQVTKRDSCFEIIKFFWKGTLRVLSFNKWINKILIYTNLILLLSRNLPCPIKKIIKSLHLLTIHWWTWRLIELIVKSENVQLPTKLSLLLSLQEKLRSKSACTIHPSKY